MATGDLPERIAEAAFGSRGERGEEDERKGGGEERRRRRKEQVVVAAGQVFVVTRHHVRAENNSDMSKLRSPQFLFYREKKNSLPFLSPKQSLIQVARERDGIVEKIDNVVQSFPTIQFFFGRNGGGKKKTDVVCRQGLNLLDVASTMFSLLVVE